MNRPSFRIDAQAAVAKPAAAPRHPGARETGPAPAADAVAALLGAVGAVSPSTAVQAGAPAPGSAVGVRASPICG